MTRKTLFLTQESSKNSLALFLALACSIFMMSSAALALDDSGKGLGYARQLSAAFENVAQKITPSVVNIRTSRTLKAGSEEGQQQGIPESLERFFRPYIPRDGQKQPQGMGTGVIIDRDGHILTNNHVIGEADEIEVTLHDSKKVSASIVGRDSKTDLAVIKIEQSDLTPAKLGDSDKLKIGEWVVAAGNPFGLDNTITAGIVSAKGRSISRNPNSYEDFIQTDAAINPGNSGGPLVSLTGEVVGINTAIFSRSGGYMGIGFAIPIDLARSVMQSIISEGRVVRGWLGVVIQDLTEEMSSSFDYRGTQGALISDVAPDGPAAEAGVRAGDIVLRLDGAEVKDVNDLRNRVAAVRPGTTVKMVVFRAGRRATLKVRIGDQPENLSLMKQEKPQPKANSASELGIDVSKLTPQLAEQVGSKRQSGILVREVAPGSLAEQKGLRRGDVIISVGNTPVSEVSDFLKLIEKKKLEAGIRLSVESGGFSRFVFIKK